MQNQSIESKILFIINTIKVISFLLVISIFIYQQTNTESPYWIKYILFIVCGVAFSTLVSGMIIRKKGSIRKVIVAILILIIFIFTFLFFNFDKHFFEDILPESKIAIYILLGTILLVLLVVSIIKKQFLNKGEKAVDKTDNDKMINIEENKST